MYKLTLLAAVVAFAEAGWIGTMQHVTVKGQLACGQKSVKNVKVELWEEDSFGPDDLLNTTTSDNKGYFSIYGQEKEISVEPYLIVYHNCDGGIINEKCEVTDEFTVPKDKIDGIYEMGIVSLNVERRNHKKTCQ